MSFIKSPVPGTIIIGRFNHGPANSLRSEPSEARELFLDEQRLDVREHLLLICELFETIVLVRR